MTRATSRASLWTRATPTASSSRHWATRAERTRRAACIARATAARRGSAFCSRTIPPAPPTSRWTRRTREFSSRRCGTCSGTPWGFTAGNGSLWRSTDGGDTWRDISGAPGIPKNPLGRIGVSVSRANSQRVYATIECPPEDSTGGIFRSDDDGVTWQRTNGDQKWMVRPWYYGEITADPRDTNTVYVMNLSTWKSTDGGHTFRAAAIAARRHARAVDRSGRPAPHDQRQRRRCDDQLRRRLQLVVDHESTDGAVLPRRDRRPVAVPHLRRAAGQHDGLDREQVGRRRDR